MAFATVADLALSIALGFAFEEDAPWLAGVMIFVGILVVTMLLGLRTIVWEWLWFQWKGRDLAVEILYAELSQHDLPPPDACETSANEFLERIAGDEDVPIKTRLYATSMASALMAARQQGLSAAVRSSIVAEKALSKLRATA